MRGMSTVAEKIDALKAISKVVGDLGGGQTTAAIQTANFLFELQKVSIGGLPPEVVEEAALAAREAAVATCNMVNSLKVDITDISHSIKVQVTAP
jgi:hypothetical protein